MYAYAYAWQTSPHVYYPNTNFQPTLTTTYPVQQNGLETISRSGTVLSSLTPQNMNSRSHVANDVNIANYRAINTLAQGARPNVIPSTTVQQYQGMQTHNSAANPIPNMQRRTFNFQRAAESMPSLTDPDNYHLEDLNRDYYDSIDGDVKNKDISYRDTDTSFKTRPQGDMTAMELHSRPTYFRPATYDGVESISNSRRIPLQQHRHIIYHDDYKPVHETKLMSEYPDNSLQSYTKPSAYKYVPVRMLHTSTYPRGGSPGYNIRQSPHNGYMQPMQQQSPSSNLYAGAFASIKSQPFSHRPIPGRFVEVNQNMEDTTGSHFKDFVSWVFD